MAPTEELTEYERERLAKIERNKALMERRARARTRSRASAAREASAGENVV